MTLKAKPSAPPHAFTPDPDLGTDHAGRATCRSCHKLGAPGDAQHPDPADLPPAPPAQRLMDRRYDPEEGTDA